MGLEGAVGLQESRFLQRVCSGLEASNLRFIGFYCGFGVRCGVCCLGAQGYGVQG